VLKMPSHTYSSSTLVALANGIQRYLRENNRAEKNVVNEYRYICIE
jgi:hypothetical protein